MDPIKPKLIINAADRVAFHHDCLQPMLAQYFNIINYEDGVNYPAKECTVITHGIVNRTWYRDLVNAGAGLILDALWEHHVAAKLSEQHLGQELVLSAKNYFWVNEYYLHCQEGYNSYQPNRHVQHLALLPIGQTKPHRQQLLTALGPTLDRIVYSQADQGRYLPGDMPSSDGRFDRYFNPAWYDSTYFSIVSETTTYSKYSLHVTEKTFKPISYRHPFVVFGQTGTLAYLHELGFETFENLFDESYDLVEDQPTRLAQIVDNVQNFKETAHDAVTLAKLEHNHNLFYNADRVQQMFINDIITPILEYVNKT